MRYAALSIALLWAQSTLPDSLQALFEKDFQFDVVLARTFPVQPTSTDTFPLSPFLSGHVRVGIAWHWYLRGKWAISVQPGFAWYRQAFRATSASKAPPSRAHAGGLPLAQISFRCGLVADRSAFQRPKGRSAFPQILGRGGGMGSAPHGL